MQQGAKWWFSQHESYIYQTNYIKSLRWNKQLRIQIQYICNILGIKMWLVLLLCVLCNSWSSIAIFPRFVFGNYTKFVWTDTFVGPTGLGIPFPSMKPHEMDAMFIQFYHCTIIAIWNAVNGFDEEFFWTKKLIFNFRRFINHYPIH